jgi:hypothetical protein
MLWWWCLWPVSHKEKRWIMSIVVLGRFSHMRRGDSMDQFHIIRYQNSEYFLWFIIILSTGIFSSRPLPWKPDDQCNEPSQYCCFFFINVDCDAKTLRPRTRKNNDSMALRLQQVDRRRWLKWWNSKYSQPGQLYVCIKKPNWSSYQ